MRAAGLAAALFLFWLALSGHYTSFLMTIGAVACLFCVIVAHKFRTVDEEGVPFQVVLGAITYLPWLLWEIVKSAWSVTKIIIDPELPISPTMTVLDVSQKTNMGVNVYANSITLTPGTITTGVNGKSLIVHALVREGADDLEGGAMDRRVTRFERGL